MNFLFSIKNSTPESFTNLGGHPILEGTRFWTFGYGEIYGIFIAGMVFVALLLLVIYSKDGK